MLGTLFANNFLVKKEEREEGIAICFTLTFDVCFELIFVYKMILA